MRYLKIKNIGSYNRGNKTPFENFMLVYRESIPVFTYERHGNEHLRHVSCNSQPGNDHSRLWFGNSHPMTGYSRHRNEHSRHGYEHMQHGNEHSETSKKQHLSLNKHQNSNILQFLSGQNIQKWSPETDTKGKEENGLWQTLSHNRKAS